MASDLSFVEFVVDQFDEDCVVTYKRMFGEFGLYSDGEFFALICDDRLFMKPTEGGRSFIGEVVEASPYPGAKPSLLIGDQIEDRQWLSESHSRKRFAPALYSSSSATISRARAVIWSGSPLVWTMRLTTAVARCSMGK